MTTEYKKRTFAVCLIILLTTIAISGCKRGTEEAPTGPVTTFKVEGTQEEESWEIDKSLLGVRRFTDDSFYALGIVKEVSGRKVILELEDSEYEVHIPEGINYKGVYGWGPENTVTELDGDHFTKIKVGEVLGVVLKEDMEGTLHVYDVIVTLKGEEK